MIQKYFNLLFSFSFRFGLRSLCRFFWARALRPKPLPVAPCFGGARGAVSSCGSVGLSSAAARARALVTHRPCALLPFSFHPLKSWRGALTFPSLRSVGMAPRSGAFIARGAYLRPVAWLAYGSPCGESLPLVTQSVGQKCGAVVPHCDFQKYLPEIALKQEDFPFAHTRNARSPPHPHPCARGMPG